MSKTLALNLYRSTATGTQEHPVAQKLKRFRRFGPGISRAVTGHEKLSEHTPDAISSSLREATAASDLPVPEAHRQLGNRSKDAPLMRIQRNSESRVESTAEHRETKKTVNIEPLDCLVFSQAPDTRSTRTVQMARRTRAEIHRRHCDAVSNSDLAAKTEALRFAKRLINKASVSARSSIEHIVGSR